MDPGREGAEEGEESNTPTHTHALNIAMAPTTAESSPPPEKYYMDYEGQKLAEQLYTVCKLVVV